MDETRAFQRGNAVVHQLNPPITLIFLTKNGLVTGEQVSQLIFLFLCSTDLASLSEHSFYVLWSFSGLLSVSFSP